MTSGGVETDRRPEKSSFSVTCSLLGKYIKEKGSIVDLGLGVLDSAPSGKPEAHRPPTTMSLLSMSLLSMSMKEAKEPEKAQLTLFYGGKVLVLDNFPAENAKDLMQLSSKGQTFTSATPTSVAVAASVMADVQRSSTETKHPASFRAGAQPKFSDLPIARKASLHCFLKKRRDRFAKAAPYTLSSSSGPKDVAVKKEEISQPCLGLA